MKLPLRLHRPAGLLAVADLALLAITVTVLVSGFWDLTLGHPARFRWYSVAGVLLAAATVMHTVRAAQTPTFIEGPVVEAGHRRPPSPDT